MPDAVLALFITFCPTFKLLVIPPLMHGLDVLAYSILEVDDINFIHTLVQDNPVIFLD